MVCIIEHNGAERVAGDHRLQARNQLIQHVFQISSRLLLERFEHASEQVHGAESLATLDGEALDSHATICAELAE